MDSSEPGTSPDNAQQIKKKKGVRNVVKYQRNVIKLSRVKGTQYKNYKRKIVEAKRIGSE